MSNSTIELGFHTSKGLYFKRLPEDKIQITITDMKGEQKYYQQIESVDSIASAMAHCSLTGDTAEQHQKFVDLLNS